MLFLQFSYSNLSLTSRPVETNNANSKQLMKPEKLWMTNLGRNSVLETVWLKLSNLYLKCILMKTSHLQGKYPLSFLSQSSTVHTERVLRFSSFMYYPDGEESEHVSCNLERKYLSYKLDQKCLSNTIGVHLYSKIWHTDMLNLSPKETLGFIWWPLSWIFLVSK